MKKITALAMLSLLALSSSLASAADSGWYAGAGAGASAFNGTGSDFVTLIPGEALTNSKLIDTSTGYKLFGGKQFNENWGVELAYTSLGKFTYDSDVTNGEVLTGTEHSEAKPECWSLSGVGILPVGSNFSLMGKAGVCLWDDWTKAIESDTSGEITEVRTSDRTHKGANLTFGLGAKYNITNNLGVRVEWESFDNVVNNASSVHMWSGSLQYGF
jgi:OOP family OmpA-OmpF porin